MEKSKNEDIYVKSGYKKAYDSVVHSILNNIYLNNNW